MTVPDVVVELTAAAETLRERAMRCEKHADCMFVGDRKADALATLIDGMVAEDERLQSTMANPSNGWTNRYWSGCDASHERALRLLATYTRTVLGSTT